jgi:putative membrane-bound dehydrogenase-like protein
MGEAGSREDQHAVILPKASRMDPAAELGTSASGKRYTGRLCCVRVNRSESRRIIEVFAPAGFVSCLERSNISMTSVRPSRASLFLPRLYLVWLSVSTATLLGNVAAVSAAEPAKSLADELPHIPPVAPAKTLSTFHLEHGFRLELVAAEPLVASPVDACFDENGRMYVAEMRDYPFSWEPTKLNPRGGGKKDAGVIRLLEDTNGDGKFDKSTVFADKLTWPTSVCCYDGGIFVLAPPHLWYLKDTNGDGVADVRKIVLSGFNRDNVQAITNSLKWSLDNRIVFAAGRNGGNLLHDGKKVFSIRGQDISFNPATLEISAITGGEQFGLSFDDWGNRFVCNNSNHIEQVVLEDRYVRRNPYIAVSDTIRSIAKEGPAASVFRRSPPEPWRVVRTRRRVSDPAVLRTLPHTEQFAIGYFTSAAGVTIYRGDAYPAEFRGNAFIGDVGGNLVHRKTLSRNGPLFTAVRADDNTEFIASTDNWFRPVNFVNAPDGTLYIIDMYRETIEHPFSIPDDIKAHLDLQTGDRGRVYRLASPGFQRHTPPRLGEQWGPELVRFLGSKNVWRRETAQRLLVERKATMVAPELENLVKHSSAPLGRLHALYTLQGLDRLSDELLALAISDADPRVRAHAIRLSEPRLKSSAQLLNAAARKTDDEDGLVRFQLALSLGDAPAEETVAPLARLARQIQGDELLRTALLTSVAHNADQLARHLLADERFLHEAAATGFLAELASIVGTQADSAKAIDLLQAVFLAKSPELQAALLQGFAQGLGRRGSSLANFLDKHGNEAGLGQSAAAVFKRATAIAADQTRGQSDRITALRLLAFAPYAEVAPVLTALLSPQTSPELQAAAIAALANQDNAGVGRQLLAGWKSFGPAIRRDVIDAVLHRPARLGDLFHAIEAREIARGEIERDVKQLLMNHPNTAIRNRARALFAGDVSGDRGKIVAVYRPALAQPGRVERGRDVYERRCATCHRFGNAGHAVGPDIVSVQNKSPADLLIAILDPSREAQPNFIAYNVVTAQGAVYSGIIAAESAAGVTLRRAEGKEDKILRNQIEEIVSTGKSLMPEGLEKDISPDQMADLIAFIKSTAVAPSR